MSVLPTINEIAKASVLADEQDLPALVGIHDRIRAVCGELSGADLDAVSDCLEHAAELIERIVHREAEDAVAALELVRRGIEFAQKAAAADEEGRSVRDLGPSPFESPAAGTATRACDPELVASWVAECGHTLADLESQVVSLDASSPQPDTLAEVRRRLHTIKGECGVLSLHAAQRLCHQAETAIDRCTQEGAALPVDGLLALVDWMRGYVGTLGTDPRAPAPAHEGVLALFAPASDQPTTPPAPGVPKEPADAAGPGVGDGERAAVNRASSDDDSPVALVIEGDVKDTLNDFLCESREHIAGSEQALLKLEEDPGNKELINTVFRAFHTIKGVAGFMNLKPIVSLAHSAEFLLDAARNDRVALDSPCLGLILRTCDLMGQLIRVLEGGPAPTTGQLRSMIEQLEQAEKGGAVSAPPATGGASTERPDATKTSSDTATSPAPAAHPAQSGATAKRADQTVKVSTSRMDTLVDMVGELVIAQQMVVQDPAVRVINEQRVQRNLAMVGKIIRDLQEVSMSLRMVPIKATFQKMARLVRDVSAKAGKHIVLHTEGEDVELDRNVVEEIADPLVHMIRNSCDHGVEPAEARRAAGKPETGNIWLRAFHSGGSIVIEIQDDGRGLDRSRILAKAVEKGIYTPDRPQEEIPDNEVFNLIFLPGFSTAERVTDISGRGVGMDVVRRNIEALRGTIDIRSTPGRGTTFSMRLPLTMAIIDGMVVRVGSQRYVIPTLSIERSFRPREGDISTVIGRGEMVSVRGSLLPIYRLNRTLNLDEGRTAITEALLIVVESNNTRCCLVVDEILGQQQVVIKSLGQGIGPLQGVSGGAILGDGRVALIIDVGGLINQATRQPREDAAPGAPA